MIVQTDPNASFALYTVIQTLGGLVAALALLLAIRDFLDWRRTHTVVFLFYGLTRLGSAVFSFQILELLLRSESHALPLTLDTGIYATAMACSATGLVGVHYWYPRMRVALEHIAHPDRSVEALQAVGEQMAQLHDDNVEAASALVDADSKTAATLKEADETTTRKVRTESTEEENR